jgi:Fe-S-cluster-containing dehydrogenase component
VTCAITERLPTDRRSFLKVLGIGAAASLAACKRRPVEHALPYLVPPEEITPGVPVRYASTCAACPAACGLLVSVLDGRPVKLEGRPDHPLSGGGLCATGQADLRALYDAGRLREPLLGGKASTWAALDAYVAAGLEGLRHSGGRLYVLSGSLVSPTDREVVERFLAPFGAVLVEYDPGPRSGSAVLEAYELLDGRPVDPFLDLSEADLLVCFGADLLGAGPEPVTHTRAWAARRREAGQRGAPRHVQVEATPTLTGAAADERWQATAGEQRTLALSLLRRVAAGVGGEEAAAVLAALKDVAEPQAMAARVEGLAKELLAHRETSLAVSGSGDVTEQLSVALLNRLLGNDGRTLDLGRPSLVRRGRDRDLALFLAALGRGEVGGVIVLGLDPVDQLPEGESLAEALGKLPLSVAVTERPTATAFACHAVAAAHHALERWGDFSPRADVVTLAQPTIRPLFDTRHPFESVLRWSRAPQTDYRLHLMEEWKRKLGGGADFAPVFSAAVSRGTLPAPPPVRAADAHRGRPDLVAKVLALAAASGLHDGDVEVELVTEVALREGRLAHVPWLRELPDPLTRVSWAACVRVAPERAKALGVTDGDLLRVEVGKRAMTLPARVMPGQHPRVLGIPVGYGRRDGDGPGAFRNAYRLARLEEGRLVARGLPARVARTGGHERLPLMQPQGSAEGRPIVFQVPRPDAKVPEEHAAAISLWPERNQTSPKWEMVIDLDACTGCSACVVACQAENNLPVVGAEEIANNRDMYWLRIDRYFAGDPADPDVLFEPMLCAQCGNAPCETVCPVAATVHSEDGLNQQVYNRCVGTRYCENNCPYKVRRFNWFNHEVKEPVERMVLNPNVVARSRGVMEKCTFCVQRIQGARIEARRGGREDWRGVGGQTACQQTCPASAISFGDAVDPNGPVARLKRSPRAFQVLADLGVRPAVTYLAHVRNRRPGASGEGEPS